MGAYQPCTFVPCGRPAVSRGHCARHRRQRNQGETLRPLRTRINDPIRAFWARVNRTDSCWLWTGRVGDRGGHGKFDVNGRGRNAHRHAWKLLRGPIPDGLDVCHNCPGGDNPLCVNPDHMFLGTQAENLADMWRKGRGARGEDHGRALLTESDVIDIRTLAPLGASRADLAREFGVKLRTVQAIVRRECWRHLP